MEKDTPSKMFDHEMFLLILSTPWMKGHLAQRIKTTLTVRVTPMWLPQVPDQPPRQIHQVRFNRLQIQFTLGFVTSLRHWNQGR